MSTTKEVESLLNKAINVDYGEIEEDENEENEKDFLNKFNIKTIIEVLRNNGKYKTLVNLDEDNEEKENNRLDIRQKLISFFEYFDVDKTGCINACHLKKILVDSFEVLTPEEFESIFFKAEIDGGGYIDYATFVYKIIPTNKDEEEKEEDIEEDNEENAQNDDYGNNGYDDHDQFEN